VIGVVDADHTYAFTIEPFTAPAKPANYVILASSPGHPAPQVMAALKVL
jgi:hypothetical protein